MKRHCHIFGTLAAMLFCCIPSAMADDVAGETVAGEADLYYYGRQTITASRDTDGSCILWDRERGIHTYDANYHTLSSNGFDTVFNAEARDVIPELLRAYKQCSGEFRSAIGDWTGHTLVNALDSITITYPSGSSSWPSFTLSIIRKSEPDIIVMHTDTLNAYNRTNRNASLTFCLQKSLLTTPAQDYQIRVYAISKTGSGKLMETVNLSDASVTEEVTTKYYHGLILHRTMRDFQPALDAHWGMERTYDFYLERYGIRSFDGQGTPIHLFINPSPLNYSEMTAYNAGAFVSSGGEGFMFFGMGAYHPNNKTSNAKPFVFIDVLAHEYTHMMVDRLTNTGEEGALNESYADIMSKNVLLYATGREEWQTGADGDYENRPVRSFSDPTAMGTPMCYGDQYWSDEADVHTNCSVQNHWFYLLCKGGEGINTLGQTYHVDAIDRRDAEDIVFKALYDYSASGMTYQDARENAIRAAEDLFGIGSQQVRSVTDAWAAVGVGMASTGIMATEAVNAREHYYSIDGIRVAQPPRGIYIKSIGGKTKAITINNQ